jgi:hypothetical protein
MNILGNDRWRIAQEDCITHMATSKDYESLIESRVKWHGDSGFVAGNMPDFLYPFQSYLVDWSLHKGRAAIFADCGYGKTAMQLAWADAVVRHTNRPVLLLTPLAVGAQTMREAAKFGIDAARSRDGYIEGEKIWITNYQQLHKFDPSCFAGVVCDESSAIKDFKSATKGAVVEFMRQTPYRLLCTATAAPNDYWELGTSSEALGYLGFRDMITTFFRQELAARGTLGWGATKYRFRGHAEHPFWSWVCSWAKCMRKPSDIGFDDKGFDLPPLTEFEHVVHTEQARDGLLFAMPGRTLAEQRQERRNSIGERVAKAHELATAHDGASVIWCELNPEGDALEREIPDAMQVRGSMDDEEKEEILDGFAAGHVKRLIIKPKIGCWGLNWQHCNRVIMFPSHSFEQYYQAVRRCWRFGQKKPVDVHLIVNEGEAGVIANLKRKMLQAERMFESLSEHMNDPSHLVKLDRFANQEVVPSWL